MFQKINISIADKIGAAQSAAADPGISTSSAPSSIDGSPGDSSIQQPDLSGINSAGPDVSQKQTQAQTGTAPQARSAAIPKDITYDRPGDSAFPTEQDPQKQTPNPKTKSFKESLIDKVSQQKSQTTTPEAENGQKGQYTPDPNIAKSPDNKRVERKDQPAWTPSNMGINDPGMPDQGGLDGIITRSKGNPTYKDSNKPTYNPIQYKAPKIEFNMPKFK